MKRTITAYVIATVASVLPALILVTLLNEWGYSFSLWQSVRIVWIAAVGVPSMFYACAKLARNLGHKSPPVLHITGTRKVAVGGQSGVGHVLADVVPTLFAPALEPLQDYHVAEEFSITQRDGLCHVRVDEQDLDDFLRRTWRRQVHGESYPLSRNWWVDQGRRIGRAEYDLVVLMLRTANLLAGRHGGQGSSGRLRWPPDKTMRELRYRLGELVDDGTQRAN